MIEGHHFQASTNHERKEEHDECVDYGDPAQPTRGRGREHEQRDDDAGNYYGDREQDRIAGLLEQFPGPVLADRSAGKHAGGKQSQQPQTEVPLVVAGDRARVGYPHDHLEKSGGGECAYDDGLGSCPTGPECPCGKGEEEQREPGRSGTNERDRTTEENVSAGAWLPDQCPKARKREGPDDISDVGEILKGHHGQQRNRGGEDNSQHTGRNHAPSEGVDGQGGKRRGQRAGKR